MIGRMSFGVKTPLIKENDDLKQIILDALWEHIRPGDIIGITESVVARAQGNYVTLDEITEEVKKLNVYNLPIRLINPIYSRNRFSMILKAFARATKDITIVMPPFDEVGNPSGINPFTGINIQDYYIELCKNEGVEHVHITKDIYYKATTDFFNVNCELHPYNSTSLNWYNLKSFCSNKTEYGLLGSNKSTEERLKLFPNTAKAQKLVDDIQQTFEEDGRNVEVMVYGDGCFKDPVGGIWEFADPVTSPAYTSGLEGVTNEIKLKAFIDQSQYSGKALEDDIISKIKAKPSNLKASMDSQGTTPRRKIDFLASLMDLTSGSGDAGTPIVVVRNYSKTYAD